jgi:chromosome segregation ATPase
MPDDTRLVETVTTLYERLFRPDFERLRGEMGQTEQRLRGEMSQMEGRLRGETGSLREEVGGLREDSAALRQEVGGLRGDMGRAEHRLRGEMRVMQADIAALKQTTAEMQSDAADFHRDADGHFDAVYQRFDRLETEYHMLVEGLRRIEQQVTTDAVEHEAIRAQIRGLESAMTELRSRLSA